MSDLPFGHLALAEGEEFDAIRALLAVWGARATGIGDDAAVMDVPAHERLVVSTDASLEGVHFRREWLSPRQIGARATAAALSDLAAMAATPIGLLLALGLPDSWRAELAELAHGVGEMAAWACCPIVGGNVTRASELSLTITVLGSAAQPLSRDAARAGQALYVTGRLGGPGAALAAMLRHAVPDAAHLARFAQPRPRLDEARWLAARGARAAIDVSDGLAADAAHLASASGVALEVELAWIPCASGVDAERAIASGEEYELLVTFDEGSPPDVGAFEAEFSVPLTRIGRVVRGAGVTLARAGGRVDPPRGHDHLS